MRGTIRGLATSVAALVILAFPGPVAADGASNCVSGLNYHQWRGVTYTNSSFQIHGASGKILAYNLIRCSPPVGIETDGTFVFSNIVPAGGGANDIIQVGVGNCRAPIQCSGGMRYYSGVGLTNTTPGCAGWQNRLPALIEHSGYTYADHVLKVYHHNNQWEFISDSTVLRTFPETSLCWTPKTAVWFAEIWDYGDQLGGTSTAQQGTIQLSYATVENGSFSLTPQVTCSYGGSGAPFYCAYQGNSAYYTWTTER